jgi:KaiC/GvpD/RAD55 family RecA-like ATPase
MSAAQEISTIAEKPTFERMGTKFQESLCNIIMDDSVFAAQIGEVLDVSFLELKYLRLFVQKIYDYRTKYGVHPSRDTMSMILRADISSESEVLQKQVREYFARVTISDISIDGAEHIKDTSLDFCRKQKLKEAMIKSVELIKSSSYDEVSKVINDALKLGTDNNHGYDYMIDFEKRFELKARNPVSSGWDLIDGITRGGLGRGELGVVVAPTGAGKSMALVHLGAAALRAGKNVVHYTLELQDKTIATRYDSCLTGMNLTDIQNNKDIVFDGIKNINGKLLIKEYPTKTASTMTLRAHLDKLKTRGHRIDFIIVDYGDLLRPVTKDREKRQELESIYEEMRAIAQIYDCVVWTASQTNRSGLNAEVITMESISEAFNKCFVADFICTISRTIKDKAANEGRMYVAKNRNGPDGMVYPLFMDTKNVCIKVLQESEESANDIIVRSAKEQEDNLKKKYKEFKKEKKTT